MDERKAETKTKVEKVVDVAETAGTASEILAMLFSFKSEAAIERAELEARIKTAEKNDTEQYDQLEVLEGRLERIQPLTDTLARLQKVVLVMGVLGVVTGLMLGGQWLVNWVRRDAEDQTVREVVIDESGTVISDVQKNSSTTNDTSGSIRPSATSVRR